VEFDLTIDGSSTDECFDFSLRHGTRVIPATFWNAQGSSNGRPPLTLLQHGGPLHKRHEFSDFLARSILARTGGAVLLIDGPIHGRRRTEQLELTEMLTTFKQYWQEDADIDGMVSDWKHVLDAVLDQGWADPKRVAWFGLSMGTAYGIPVCAADERIRAAAIGMWGTDWGQGVRLIHDARRMRTSVLFQIKTEDEIFSIEGQRELFDALSCPNKCLSTFPGGHSVSAPGQLDQLLDFVAHAFRDEGSRSTARAITAT
jgi:dienelactone hydrolase